jgi:hypothetical protein
MLQGLPVKAPTATMPPGPHRQSACNSTGKGQSDEGTQVSQSAGHEALSSPVEQIPSPQVGSGGHEQSGSKQSASPSQSLSTKSVQISGTGTHPALQPSSVNPSQSLSRPSSHTSSLQHGGQSGSKQSTSVSQSLSLPSSQTVSPPISVGVQGGPHPSSIAMSQSSSTPLHISA